MNLPCLVSFPICWLVTAIALEAADAAPPPPKLTGIARIQGKTLAFLELAPGGGFGYADKPILKVGESTGPIEVLRINSKKPEVTLRDRASGRYAIRSSRLIAKRSRPVSARHLPDSEVRLPV